MWKASTVNANGTYFSGVCYRFPDSPSKQISASYDCAVTYSTKTRYGYGSLKLTPDGSGSAYTGSVKLSFGSTYYLDLSDFDNLVIVSMADTAGGSFQVQLEDNKDGGTYWMYATFATSSHNGFQGSLQGTYGNWNVQIYGSEENFGDAASDTYWGETNTFNENYLNRITIKPSYNGGSQYFEQIIFVKRASSFSHEFTHNPSVIGGRPNTPLIKDRVPGRAGYKFQYTKPIGRNWDISGDIIEDPTYYQDKFYMMYNSNHTFLFVTPDICAPVKIEDISIDRQSEYGVSLIKYSMSLQEIIGKD